MFDKIQHFWNQIRIVYSLLAFVKDMSCDYYSWTSFETRQVPTPRSDSSCVKLCVIGLKHFCGNNRYKQNPILKTSASVNVILKQTLNLSENRVCASDFQCKQYRKMMETFDIYNHVKQHFFSSLDVK